ncbi:hypothetical protein Ciccas_006923 [Cichlidogyrus casuarinus]|uniref:G domain-containing protein n=1 Tax=Cichlidogyrus casuarinus TaxID=1844966 RepID=A0ABD2Q503_9PLAT
MTSNDLNPILVGVLGPKRVGKTTLISILIKGNSDEDNDDMTVIARGSGYTIEHVRELKVEQNGIARHIKFCEIHCDFQMDNIDERIHTANLLTDEYRSNWNRYKFPFQLAVFCFSYENPSLAKSILKLLPEFKREYPNVTLICLGLKSDVKYHQHYSKSNDHIKRLLKCRDKDFMMDCNYYNAESHFVLVPILIRLAHPRQEDLKLLHQWHEWKKHSE